MPSNNERNLNPKYTFMYGVLTGVVATASIIVLFHKFFTKTEPKPKPEENSKSKDKSNSKSLNLSQNLKSDPVFLKLKSKPLNLDRFKILKEHQNSIVHRNYIQSINLLVEYLSRSIIKIVFEYVDDCKSLSPPLIIENYLEHGWNPRPNVLYDNPEIFVENVLPIRNQPSLIITIGLPGSGKTTWAKTRCKSKRVVAADDYFDKFNRGQFDASKLGAAHDWCQSQIFDQLKNGVTCVANNTNTTLWEMNAYVRFVVMAALPFKIVFAIMPEQNVNVLAKRNIHTVPAKKLRQMQKRFLRWYNRGPPTIRKILKKLPMLRLGKDTSKSVLFTAVFVDRSVRTQLQQYFREVSGCQLLERTTDCHLTIKFKPMNQQVRRLPIGETIKLRIVAYAKHDYVQAFLVDILDDAIKRMCQNKYPHITISSNPNFVSPVYANFLIEHGTIYPLIDVNKLDFDDAAKYNQVDRFEGLIVEGTVGYRPMNGDNVLSPPKDKNSNTRRR